MATLAEILAKHKVRRFKPRNAGFRAVRTSTEVQRRLESIRDDVQDAANKRVGAAWAKAGFGAGEFRKGSGRGRGRVTVYAMSKKARKLEARRHILMSAARSVRGKNGG